MRVSSSYEVTLLDCELFHYCVASLWCFLCLFSVNVYFYNWLGNFMCYIFCVNYCAKASHENPWLLRLGIKLQWIVRCPLTILAWDRAQLFLLILKLIKMTYHVKMKLNRTLNFPHAWFLVEYMRAWGSLDGSGVDCEMVRRGIVRHETVRHDLVKHVKHETVRHEAVRHEIVSRRSGWLQS